MKPIKAKGLEFIPISSGSSWLGSDKGGWIHASQRPRYEVRLPSYYIMEKPLTRGQFARLLDEDESPDEPDQPMTGLTIDEIHALRKAIESNLEEESLDVRLPSFPEWNHASEQIELNPGIVEILSDAAAPVIAEV